jgi:hypothetical protein
MTTQRRNWLTAKVVQSAVSPSALGSACFLMVEKYSRPTKVLGISRRPGLVNQVLTHRQTIALLF